MATEATGRAVEAGYARGDVIRGHVTGDGWRRPVGLPAMRWPARLVRFAAGRAPGPVWAATAAFAALLAAYSVLVPLYEAPDEPAHVDLAFHLAAGGDYPAYDERDWSSAVLTDCSSYTALIRPCPGPGQTRLTPGIRPHREADAPSKPTRPTFAEAGGDEQLAGQTNQLAQHPPLYYRAMATVLQIERAVVPGELPMGTEVALLRLVNSLLVAPLPLLAWATARRLGVSPRVGTTAALLVLVVPQLAHIGSTVNNDNLLILLLSGAAVLAAGVARGDRSWRTAVALGSLTGAAMLTKSSGAVLAGGVAAAYAAGWWRTAPEARRRELLAVAGRLAVAGALAAAVAGWWYVRNRIDHGRFAPSVDDERIDERLQRVGFEPDPEVWARAFFAYVPPRFWGWFGWFSVRQNFRLMVAASVVAVALVAAGLGLGPRRERAGHPATRAAGRPAGRPADRLALATALVPGLLLLALVIGRGWHLYSVSSRFPFLQGRYLFPALTAGAVVAAVGLVRLTRTAAPLVALGWAAVMHGDALRAILPGYWGGPGLGPRGQLRAAVAWSPWPGELLALGAVAAVAAFGALVLTTALSLRQDRPPTPRPTGPSPTGRTGTPTGTPVGTSAGASHAPHPELHPQP